MSLPRVSLPPVRAATADDVPRLVALVRALAAYEQALPDVGASAIELVELTEGLLADALAAGEVSALVSSSMEGPVVGMALWFPTFSTWTGRSGVHLEDLWVEPEHRGEGHGRALLAALAALTVQRGGRRLEWAVLDANAPALTFYDRRGARALSGWATHRLDGADLLRVAAEAGPGPAPVHRPVAAPGG